MGYFAQPPGFVPEVCPRGEGRGVEALKLEDAWDKAVPVSEKCLASGQR